MSCHSAIVVRKELQKSGILKIRNNAMSSGKPPKKPLAQDDEAKHVARVPKSQVHE